MLLRNRARTATETLRRRFLLTGAAMACLLAGFSGCTGDSNLLGLLSDLGRTLPEVPATMTPMSGSIAGGTKVTIRGEGFLPTHVVLFDGQTPASFTVINDGLIEVVTGPHAPGPVNVVLERPKSPAINIAGQFTFLVPADIETPVTIESVTPAIGSTDGGTKVTISGQNFKLGTAVLFGGFLGEETEVTSDRIITSVAPAQGAGAVDVAVLVPEFPAAVLAGGFSYVDPGLIDNGENPRVVGATSTGNESLLLTFTKPMGASAEEVGNYTITGSEGDLLVITEVELLSDLTTVFIGTFAQDADQYTVSVVNVQDYFGRDLAAPDGVLAPPSGPHPSRASFFGTPPVGAEINKDSDNDTLPDWLEQRGWFSTIRRTNGETATILATSSPRDSDTDDDGLDDRLESVLTTDPRSRDTDSDLLDDYAEWKEWFSDPLNQDTDSDTFSDSLETSFFKTSPILADTDGDQWTDNDEILNRNRNARRSDIPLPQIRVGTPAIFIRETYAFTDERGTNQTRERSSSNTLGQSSSRTLSTSDTQSSENTDKFSQEIGTEFTIGGQDPFGGFKVNAKVGFEQTRQRGYSSTVSNESAQSSSQEFQNSISEGTSFSESRAFSRTIDEARLNLDVTISNLGDVAFTLSDLELSAFVRDPIRKEDVPLATLLSERSIAGDDEQFNLGPFDTDRGPFIFRDIQIFPNVAEQVRAAPQALTIKIANFNIRDESGRLFSFSSQDINDRTAGIIIDFGNGEVEAHRVATANKFDASGRSLGITMREALANVLGISLFEGETTPIANPNSPTVRNSYGTIVGSDGIEILTRVRGVQTTVGGGPRDRKFWAIISSQPLPDGVDFSDTVLRAGTNYSLQFVQDRDSDGLFASTEYLYGCSDDSADTDNDTLSDFDEVRTGWLLRIPGNERRVFPDPTRVDSDGDGVADSIERQYGTDPRKADTDEDGVRDNDEIAGYEVILFDGDDDPTNNPSAELLPYTDEAIIDGGNLVANTTATGDDEQVVAVGSAVQAGAAVVRPGPNGRIDTQAAGDDFRTFGPTIIAGVNETADTTASGDDIQLVAAGEDDLDAGTPIIGAGLNGRIDSILSLDDRERAGHEQFFASDPLRRDTDADSLFDGRERILGSHPNNPKDAGTVVDTDFDGMVDAEETSGWEIVVNGTAVQVTSDTLSPDTDSDGLPDVMERVFRMNPRARDTDGDGIADRVELDPADPRGYFPPGTFDEFSARCAVAEECHYTPPTTPVGTNPCRSDTDSDGRTDAAEVNVGWTVRVFGQPDREVMSDPFVADADTDNLNDAQELSYGTDPANSDTDGDRAAVGGNTANDGYEITNRLTNPLKPDMRVTFTYTSIYMSATACGDGTVELEGGALYLRLPNSGSDTLLIAEIGCSQDVEYGGTYDFGDAARTFTLATNESFTASSTTFKDHDDASCATHGLDDDMGSFSQAYSYPVGAGNQEFTCGAGECTLRVNATITIE